VSKSDIFFNDLLLRQEARDLIKALPARGEFRDRLFNRTKKLLDKLDEMEVYYEERI